MGLCAYNLVCFADLRNRIRDSEGLESDPAKLHWVICFLPEILITNVIGDEP